MYFKSSAVPVIRLLQLCPVEGSSCTWKPLQHGKQTLVDASFPDVIANVAGFDTEYK